MYTLQQFISDTQAVVRCGLGSRETVEALSPMLQRIVSRPDCLTDIGELASPDRTFDLYVDEELTISVIVWQPGSGARAHNHNGWAMVGVIEGHERNTGYRRKSEDSGPWEIPLEAAGTIDIYPGQTSYVLPPDDIHAVTIPLGKTVAIHVFGNNIHRQWRYTVDPDTGQVSPFHPPTR